MPVPDTLEIRRALLELLSEGNPQYMPAQKCVILTAEHLGMYIAPTQKQDTKEFKDRITESLHYLINQHMISNPSKYTYIITKRGKNVLQDKPETTDEKLDTLPDDLDLAGDDAEVVDDDDNAVAANDAVAVNNDVDAANDAVAENDSVDAENDTVAANDTVAENDSVDAVNDTVAVNNDVDAENDTVAANDSVDAANDAVAANNGVDVDADTVAVGDNAPVEESYTSEPSDTDTPISIDEVDPDMPKDDFPADDFSTTEDFSSAVNQALNIEDVLERHNTELADKVLMRTASLSPEMFAVFVTDLLSKMGYNAFQTARYTPESEGNSMIQGVILDPKAKSPIYIHADKLSPGRTVGRSDMHDFADELAEKGGTGIFATTGEFSEQARIYAQDERIMLIDGKKLAGLMIANNFCVNVAKVFEVKELDDDSFSEYE